MLWLKKCTVPSLRHEVVTAELVFATVCLVFGELLAIVPVTVVNIESGDKMLANELCESMLMKKMLSP